jgi:hypothetical protein
MIDFLFNLASWRPGAVDRIGIDPFDPREAL